jgi:uncharacterized repeat protein (TIGR01451 family)
MVWQNLFNRLSKANRRSTRKTLQRQLRLERMERREVLASNLGAIAGVAFIDQNNDGSLIGDPPVPVGTQVQLFRDANANGVFDPGPGADVLVGTDLTDASGAYRFDSLSPARYFLQQTAAPGLNAPALTAVVVTNDAGLQTALIDDYSTTASTLLANSANPTQFASINASEAIGGNRDISVTLTSGGSLLLDVVPAQGQLTINSGGDGLGTSVIQYDGSESTATLNATGLGGVSLGGGAPGAAIEPNAGLIAMLRAENAGDQITITVFTDASNSSRATVSIPPNASVLQEILIPFTMFSVASGTGADFNNVGAIETSVPITVVNNDVFVSIVEARRPEVVTANLANIQPLTLGGQVFLDNSAAGQNNGFRESSEPGVTGVTVELYQLTNPTDVVDPTAVPLTSTTTGANGTYNFAGLDPGHYAVVIPESQFQAGATLFGFANSTGNDPAPDPDNNVDNDDNGVGLVGGDLISGTITLVSNSEPINDDDTDANTNTTLDLGFFPQIDLIVTKTVNAAGSTIVAGGNVLFDMVVQNGGPRNATGVVFQDVLPAGLTFTGLPNSLGLIPNVSGSTVTVNLGNVPAGTSVSFQLTASIAANQTADITNTATVSGVEVDTNPANNSESELLNLISSDLRIVKTDVTDPVNAGTQLTYQITVTNDGPDAAAGVIVTDPLPANVTFVSGNVGGASNLVSFNAATGVLTATVGTLANGASALITVVVGVAGDAASPLSNTATVTASPNSDPNPSNNTSTQDTTVQRLVDVQIDKTVTGTPIAGRNVTYTLAVTNPGPSQARAVSVVDTLDADLSFVSFDPGVSGVTLSRNGQTLTFDVGLLDANETNTFSFVVAIDSAASGTIPNVATVSTTDNDSNNANNTDSVDVTVQRQVDLILTKDVDRATAIPGQNQLVYTFTVRHDSDSASDAANVVVTDTLPAGLVGAVITAPTASDTDFTNGTVRVEFDSIPVGQTRTFTVTTNIASTAAGNVTNTATVVSAGTELDPTNNTDNAVTAMTPQFDIVVTKTVNDAAPNPNEAIIYTVGLTNEGPSVATDIVLSDVIPAGLTFVSGTLQGQAATVSGNTISFPGITLGAAASASATLNFTVNAGASGTITNTATVPDNSGRGENDITNNSGSVPITVVPQADVRIAKTVSLAQAQVGSNLTYTITVTNSGPSSATGIVVTDTLPAGVTFTSGTGPGGELTAVGGVVTIDGGTLANNGTFTATINGTVAAGAAVTQTNTATVTATTADTNATNNSATAVTAVDPLTSTIAGFVYVDANSNGTRDTGEVGIAGVQITLTGTDTLGNAVNRAVTTDNTGQYLISNLAAGTYTVRETQPAGFRDGSESVGTGATATAGDDVFTALGLGVDTDAANFNFGERSERLSKRRFLASS